MARSIKGADAGNLTPIGPILRFLSVNTVTTVRDFLLSTAGITAKRIEYEDEFEYENDWKTRVREDNEVV